MNRYHRQSILPEFGEQGQQALRGAHVLVVGAGALGCPALDLLARAGVGHLSVLDRDIVEETNLQRQTLFAQADIGRAKAEAAAERLRAINPTIRVEAIAEDLTGENAEAIVLPHPRPGVVLDCTDNFLTRYLLNDVCVKHALPLVYGGAVATRGVQLTIRPGLTACLRCLFPDEPAPGAGETCDTAGVLAPVTAIIGATQAADALKLLVAPHRLSDTMLSFDLWSNRRSRISLRSARDPDCPTCAQRRFVCLDAAHSEPRTLCGRNSVQVPAPARSARIDLRALHARLANSGTFAIDDKGAGHLSGKLADGTPLHVFADGRAIIGATTDHARARSIYARFIGL